MACAASFAIEFDHMTTKNSPIDKIRDAAFSLRVGAEGDDSHIVDFYKIGQKRMLLIKEKGIYEVTLPDQIDPQRTNATLRPAQQRVLEVGAEDETVGRILFGAKALFEPPMLGNDFDYVGALSLAYSALRDLIAMRDTQNTLSKDLAAESTQFQNRTPARDSVHLPSAPNIHARCDSFGLKAHHVAKSVKDMTRLFYADAITNKWVDALASVAASRHPPDNPLAKFLKDAAPLLLFVINLRNAMEHPLPNQRVVVTDYSINESGNIIAPTIEVIHPTTPQSRIDALEFMLRTTETLVDVVEGMIACLCAVNVKPIGQMQVVVGFVPEKMRRNSVRFGYFGEIGGRMVPFG